MSITLRGLFAPALFVALAAGQAQAATGTSDTLVAANARAIDMAKAGRNGEPKWLRHWPGRFRSDFYSKGGKS
jgi:hypothetical protein